MHFRRFLWLMAIVGLCSLVSLPVAAKAADPLLTILMTGNTYGNVAPCPS